MKRNGIGALVLFAYAALAHGYDALVEKKTFTVPIYTTTNGATIKNVKVGWEAYGTLAPNKDNAILIPHFFSGSSHFAGKYKADDKAPGLWDGLIGAGKMLDTDKYYVISVDSLSNLNTKDPNVVTTGPASINPDTGKPYGMSFPVISMRDSVNVQKALMDSLGIKKLAAVMGASGGSIQAMEWATGYPDMVERAIGVICPGLEIHPYTIALLEAWAMPIRMDPAWNNGDYYGKAEPEAGLAQALKMVALSGNGYGSVARTFDHKWAKENADPGKSLANDYAINATWLSAANARVKTLDANSYLYMVRANQLFNVSADAPKIKAKILFIPAKSDLIFPPEQSRAWAEKLRALGKSADVFEIDGDNGHYDGLFKLGQASERIKTFLAQ